MELILYVLARSAVAFLQALPLRWVARLGRGLGALFHAASPRYRKLVRQNLEFSFGKEKSPDELDDITSETFRRICENLCCAVKTAAMSYHELEPHIRFTKAEPLVPKPGRMPDKVVIAIGHFGNFELFARFAQYAPYYTGATTYRSLRQPSLNRLMKRMRERSGCHFFERRTDAEALKTMMSRTDGVLLGLLADQHAGDNGYWVPFFGRECSTSSAPALFARRYNCRLFTGYCFRTDLTQWTMELGPEILIYHNGKPRPVEDIALEMNQAFEDAIRRDPANWFWIHNRWKARRVQATSPASAIDTPNQGVQNATTE